MRTATEAVAACRVCGVRTASNLVPRKVRLPDGSLEDADGYVSGLCPDCEALPEVGRGVAAALSLLGREDEDLGLAAQAFDEAGVDVSRLLYGEGREPQRKPWAHVSRETRADLRRGAARLLDLKVHRASDHDRPVPPHAPGPEYPQACLACGVAKSADWHGPTTTGAYTKPGLVTGVLCDGCIGHFVAAGYTHGPQVLERAVMAHFGKEWSEVVRLPRLRAWVATGLPPQDRPWGWVSELVDPPPVLDPIVELRAAVADLRREVAELRARQAK